MKKPKQTDNLFPEFPPVSGKQWEEQIKKDLNGADYKTKLKWDTLEGIAPLPFYLGNNPERTEITLPKKTHSFPQLCEPIYETVPAEINKSIKKALAGGADAVSLNCSVTGRDLTLGGNMMGAQIHTQTDFDTIFDDIDLNNCSLIVDSGMASPAILAMLLNHTENFSPARFLFDPCTYIARHGRKPIGDSVLNQIIPQMAGIKHVRALAADGLFYHRAGCTITQEAGIVLAIASEYLAGADESQRPEVARSFFARVSAGPLYFPEIAKLRALRLLWKNLLKAYRIDEAIPLDIHAQTTPQNKTVTDPHNNMLRVTSEAMAAVIGGADSLVITPFDAAFRKPNIFSRRIARNVHHIIHEEAHMGKVTDPAAGSWYIDELTRLIAEEAWKFFKLIEKQGGVVKSLENRVLQSEINSSKSTKLEAYATRKRVLTGTNQYPNPNEELPEPADRPQFTDALTYSRKKPDPDGKHLISSLKNHFKHGFTIGDVAAAFINPQKVLYTTLEEFNAGEMFDRIRTGTSNFSTSYGRKPAVTLIPAGDLKWRKARASFARNLFECAGFEIGHPDGYDSVQEALQATETAADIFVLCSSDKEYENHVQPFCENFSGKGILLLAGNPGENRQKFHDAGIDDFIMSGMNVPEFLNDILEKIKNKEAAE